MEPTAVTGLSGLIVYILVQAIKNRWLAFIPSKWMALLVPVAAAFASAGGASLNGPPGDPSAFDAGTLLGGAGTAALAYLLGKHFGVNEKVSKIGSMIPGPGNRN